MACLLVIHIEIQAVWSEILFGQIFPKVAIVCVQCIALYRAPVWLYILEDALVVALSLFFALLSFPVS